MAEKIKHQFKGIFHYRKGILFFEKYSGYRSDSCTLLVHLELFLGRIITSISLFLLQLLLCPSVLIVSISCVLSDFCPGRPLQCHSYPAVPDTLSAPRQLLTAAKATLCWVGMGVLRALGANRHPSSCRSSKERWACSFLVYGFCPWCLTNSSIIRYSYRTFQPTTVMWVLVPPWR